MERTMRNRSWVALAAGALLLAACGGDDDDDAGGDTTGATTAGTTADATAATTADTETTAGSDTTAGTGTTDSEDTTAGTDTTGTSSGTGGGGAVDLSACPNPLVIQTDWFPEAEHGSLYEMVGDGYSVDVGSKVVRGPLVAGGQETGIDIEVRSGGPAIGNEPVSVQQYADDDITLGYANTEGQVLRWSETPVVSVVAPLEINPQIIFWDPETYPEIETLADLGE